MASKFAFGYDVFAINAVDGDGELATLMEQGGAGNLTLGLAGALYDEVASESREFVRQSLAGRDAVAQKFLRPVRAIREKLAGLAFLDPAIAPLVGSIDEVLAATPKKGMIDGASLAALRGVVMLLTDPVQMREHGNLVLRGEAKGLLDDAQSFGQGGGSEKWGAAPEPEADGLIPATKPVPTPASECVLVKRAARKRPRHRLATRFNLIRGLR